MNSSEPYVNVYYQSPFGLGRPSIPGGFGNNV